jgi:hypothetical protein
MASSLTQMGENYALYGNGSNGSIARLATNLKLFTTASTPNKNGSGFVEVASGNGYTTGGQAVSLGNWTPGANGPSDRLVTLADFVWSCSGGSILNIAGAYFTDSSGNVLGWWSLPTPITMSPGDTLTVHTSTVGLQ